MTFRHPGPAPQSASTEIYQCRNLTTPTSTGADIDQHRQLTDQFAEIPEETQRANSSPRPSFDRGFHPCGRFTQRQSTATPQGRAVHQRTRHWRTGPEPLNSRTFERRATPLRSGAAIPYSLKSPGPIAIGHQPSSNENPLTVLPPLRLGSGQCIRGDNQVQPTRSTTLGIANRM